jgi:transposase-like protein
VGRPSKYEPELAQAILDLYAEGMALAEICREEGMPDRVTLWRWRKENAEFATAFARAREANAEAIEDGMARIENRVLSGEIEPQAANVVLSSQRWRARVLHPKRFGDRIELAGDESAPLVHRVERVIVKPET